MTHTPVPWTMRQCLGPNGPERSMDCAIMDATGEIIAETFEKVGRTSNGLFIERPATANAAFIVQACNNHAALRDTLRAILSADARGQELPFQEAMTHAAKLLTTLEAGSHGE